MVKFAPPTAEQAFVLLRTAGLDALSDDPRENEAVFDILPSMLEAAGKFSTDVWEPLSRSGDVAGPTWSAGQGVRMPSGYTEAYARFTDAGLGCVSAPVGFGGLGLPFALQIAVMESLGAANMAFTLCPILTGGAVEALLHHGSERQKQHYLPKLVSGAWTGTMNLTEPQAGSDLGALSSRATPLGNGSWSVRGMKIFISFGDHDMTENIVHLVLARTPRAPAGSRGISLFVVPKYRVSEDGACGPLNDVRTVSIEHKMGLHASPTCILSFGENGECVGELVGAEHGGLAAMFTMMNNARLNVGAQGVQVAERATQAAIAYALDRVQSPRPGDASRTPVAIAEHPDVRRMLMRMKAQTQAARALIYYAAGLSDRAARGDVAAGDRLKILTPIAKSHGSDIGTEVASLAVQVHGGTGYIEETGVAQLYRDVRIAAIYEGTNGIQAADLVERKLGHQNGATFAALIGEMRGNAKHDRLRSLIEACDEIGKSLIAAPSDDRLSASYPFLTMLATAICGWLLERQAEAVARETDVFSRTKGAIAAFYLDQLLPEALGLSAAATASAASLYRVPTQDLAL